jgi:hypothetical protein
MSNEKKTNLNPSATSFVPSLRAAEFVPSWMKQNAADSQGVTKENQDESILENSREALSQVQISDSATEDNWEDQISPKSKYLVISDRET